MIALLVLEAVAIGLLALLVAGLLRSHAEILRALHGMGVSLEPGNDGSRAPATRSGPRSPGVREASDLEGITPDEEAVNISVAGAAHATLVAFLSSGCSTCSGFWEAFSQGSASGLAGDARLVVVTKGPDAESPAKVRALAPKHVPIVMSTVAWERYEVPVVPYFAYVDGPSGQVVGAGAASTWDQVRSLMDDAYADGGMASRASPVAAPARRGSLGSGGAARQAQEEAELMAAGIGPGHPSLYPEREAEAEGEAR